VPVRHRGSHDRKWASIMQQQPPNPYYPGLQWRYPSQPTFAAPPPRRKVPWLVITLVALAVLIVCGVGLLVVVVVVRPLATNVTTPTSWVYGDNDTAFFISWTENGSNLTGVWDATFFDTYSTSILTTTAGLSGIHDGSKITFELLNQDTHTTSLTGTLGFRTLTVVGQDANTGALISSVFYPGNEDDYNQAVSHVRQQHATGATSTTPRISNLLLCGWLASLPDNQAT
jgi:hypothetical protein